VANLFSETTESFYWPRRVRPDQGMENIGVARLMLRKFGAPSIPFLTGLSVHNQRIERLWKDVVSYNVQHFRDLFSFMEENEYLDPLSEVDLFALHKIYTPRINKAIVDFKAYWNNHKIRTAGTFSPIQLWCNGLIMNSEDDTVIDNIDLNNFNPNDYGVDDNDRIGAEDIQTNNAVVVPRIGLHINDDQMDLINAIDVFANDGNSGINLYLEIKNILN